LWQAARGAGSTGLIHAVDKDDLDLTDQAALEKMTLEEKPNLVINAAAFTDVDGVKTNSKLAYALNETAPSIMAQTCRKLGAGLVHYSTDNVFDGKSRVPNKENDEPHPINVYGQSKLEGENAVSQSGVGFLILRTCWVYSFWQSSFSSKVLEWAKTQYPLRISSDQVGSPTWARILAKAISLALGMGRTDIPRLIQGVSGIYHLAGRGHASRFEFVIRILDDLKHNSNRLVPPIVPATSDDFPTPAR